LVQRSRQTSSTCCHRNVKIFYKEWNIIEILLLRGTNTHCFEQCKQCYDGCMQMMFDEIVVPNFVIFTLHCSKQWVFVLLSNNINISIIFHSLKKNPTFQQQQHSRSFEQCKVKITKFGTTISSNIIYMLSSERQDFL
jgi:hypothetical protein